MAAKEGGSDDPNLNAKLRLAVDKAKASNMPNDNIQRAIKAGSGAGEGLNLEEFVLEGYGPLGVAIMLSVVTDNRNRTIPEVRRVFSQHQGSLGEQGSAAYVFSPDRENPIFTVPISEEKSARQVLSLIEDLEDLEDVNEVWANYEISDEILERI